MPIIFISGYGDIPMTVRAMKGGADGFLTKPLDDRALTDAIPERPQPKHGRRRTAGALRDLAHPQQSLATCSAPANNGIMEFVVRRLLNKKVAFELGIEPVTVKAHRGQVTRKMKARSLPELVNMAALLGAAD